MTNIGLDRDAVVDIGVAASSTPQLMVTGSQLDDWLASHDTGSTIVFTNSTGTSATQSIPSGLATQYVGGGVWRLATGAIEESGVSTLVGATGNQPLGKGLTRPIQVSTNPTSSGSLDPTTDVVIRSYDYPAAGSESGSACIQNFDAIPDGVLEGTESSSDTITNNTATLLFAGNSSLLFREINSTSRVSNTETRTFTVSAAVSCSVVWEFVQSGSGTTQSAPNYGTESRSPTSRTTDINNTAGPNSYSDFTYAYNQVTSSVIQLPVTLGIEQNVAITPSIGTVTIPVSIQFPASNLTGGSYTRDFSSSESFSCIGSYSSPDPSTIPCNVPELPPSPPTWGARKGVSIAASVTSSNVYSNSWDWTTSSKWTGFIGSEVAYVEPNGNQFTRYRGTITATNPAPPLSGGNISSSNATDERAQIPGSITLTSIDVNFTSQETVDFDWHYDQGFTLYSINSPDSLPDNPSTCNMIGLADGTVVIIASKVAPTLNEGVEGDNYYETWTIGTSGAISLGPVTTYKYLGMGSTALTNTLCWPVS